MLSQRLKIVKLNRLGISNRGGYNPFVQSLEQHHYMPDRHSLSMVAAIILLSYALAHMVAIPSRKLGMQLPGFYLSISININTFASFLVAGLTAAGADMLLRDHPMLQKGATFQHMLLPSLTALVIGLPLAQLPLNLLWWLGFSIGGLLLLFVLIAEFITVDPQDIRHGMAAAGLTAVSFALFLTLAIILRFTSTRLFLILPALALASGLVSLRTLHLRLGGEWMLAPALVVFLIIGQLSAGLHYWPLSPVAYGLALLGPAYSLTSFFANLGEGVQIKKAILEPALVLMLVWGAAILVR